MLTDARKTVVCAFGLVVAVAWMLDGRGANNAVADASEAIRAHRHHVTGPTLAPAPKTWFAPAADPGDAPRFDPKPERPAPAAQDLDPAVIRKPPPIGPDFPPGLR